MAVNAIPVDQRVIDIDSRRFASIEKALVELITNSDDSYARLEGAGVPVSGKILIQYERHRRGALVTAGDEAEGMTFQDAMNRITKRQFRTVDILYGSEDNLEGFKAFAEKRKPKWTGR